MIIQKKRVHLLLFIVGIIALSISAEYCRKLVGETAASKSGQFTLLNCFDGGSGTLACLVEEGVKLYFYNIRSVHVERQRNRAIEVAVADAISQGMAAKDAGKHVQKEGAKAARLATQQAKRIIGPIMSSGWDFFEAIYYGGTMTEGFLRGTGTLFGAYYMAFTGEQSLGRFGYLAGSHLGSWIGGRIGLMVYDLVNGAEYFRFKSNEVFGTSAFGSSEDSETPAAYTSSESPEDANTDHTSNGAYEIPWLASSETDDVYETSAFRTPEVSDDFLPSETPAFTSSENAEDASIEEDSNPEIMEFHEEF